jgi:predicted secreted hydrolase
MKKDILNSPALCAWLSLAVAAPMGGCCREVWYEILTPEPAVRLPQDEASHCYGGEWWYYTGRLTSQEGRGYGIEAVIFHDPHVPVLSWIEGWVAHFAILNETTGLFHYDQARFLGPAGAESAVGHGFDLFTPLVQMSGGNGQDHLRATMSDSAYSIDLTVEDERGPIFHGKGGYVPFGRDGQSFYYSRPRMHASGILTIEGEPRQVEGNLWFDRQWGRDLRNPWVPWDWFSLRLDDGTHVMLFVFRSTDPPVALGTYIPDAGEPHELAPQDFIITPVSFWTSPHSGGTYPVSWDIEIALHNLFVAVTAVAKDQELDARASTLNVYWEGLCTVTGTRDEQPVEGTAYVELANYVR